MVRAAAGEPKYVICNGDEGDPGAFMDRMLLESFPYRIIEGMAIAAYAVGAREGFFYIRAEYPLAVERIGEALAHCRERGLLGERVLGSDFTSATVDQGRGRGVRLRRGDGPAGVDRRPSRHAAAAPALSGRERPLGQADLVNNVETYALVPWIFRHGAEAFAALGHRRRARAQRSSPWPARSAAAG